MYFCRSGNVCEFFILRFSRGPQIANFYGRKLIISLCLIFWSIKKNANIYIA